MLALAGGAAMMGRGKGAASTVGQPTGTDRRAYKPDHLGDTGFKSQPKVYDDPIMHGGVGVKHSKRPVWTGDQTMDPNRDIFMKKGGRVTGIAKRGFGRALMKGKK